jgi:two-component system nitrate/nitrite response regulator NarL
VQSGVAGILHKHHSGDELRSAIRQVAAGGVCLENDYLSSLFRSVDRTRAQKTSLTDREKQMLRFIFQGFTNKQIGTHLQISEGAVKASLHQLFDKLGARTRAQLVKIAIERYRDQL